MKKLLIFLSMLICIPAFADTLPFYVDSIPKGTLGLYQTDKEVTLYSEPEIKSNHIKKMEFSYNPETMPDGTFAFLVNEKKLGFLYVSDVYDDESKTYLISMRGQAHKDSQTGEQFYAKNIIMIHVKDELLDDPEDKGRRNLYNIGNGKGYYATNGKIEPIVWEKKTRSGKTSYFNMKGEELTINDGITWVQIVPITGSITWSAE